MFQAATLAIQDSELEAEHAQEDEGSLQESRLEEAKQENEGVGGALQES